MRPKGLKSRIFLDGGDPHETRQILDLIGFLDGQTTNPSLVSKNPAARKKLESGGKFTAEEMMNFYHFIAREISGMLPQGSISLEVFADLSTTAEQMLSQGEKMFSWISNAHIKFPSSREGLKAAERAVKEGLRVNMTLCFTQEQAAAVYAATRGAKRGDVFVSPFVGRLDDRGENGMDLIANLMRMYDKSDRHVEVLTASVRNADHLQYAIKLKSDIITAPFEILREWGQEGLPLPGDEYTYDAGDRAPIPFRNLDLKWNWQDFDISHDLTVKGMKKFSEDWNSLIR
jgi:transaldolase